MITVEHLTKNYGSVRAVRDLSFKIEANHVYGLLGPNGAGKSTTLNILSGCLAPTSGKVEIGGIDLFEEPDQAKGLLGYLTFVGQAKGLKKEELQQQLSEVLAQTGLEHMKSRLISQLSKGYRQRVGIAQALLGNPQVVILDEPTVGLDPIQIVEIRTLIRSLGENHTVIISSHILSEMQAVCDKVLIISNGQLVAFDTPEHLEGILSGSNVIRIGTLADSEEAETLIFSFKEVESFKTLKEVDALFLEVCIKEGEIRSFACRLLFAYFCIILPQIQRRNLVLG